jgi:invasion protein IalB
MTKLNATTRHAVAAAVALAGLSTAAPAVAQQAPPPGWFKQCDKQNEVDICQVQNITTAPTGALVTAVSLVEVKGKVNRKVFQVTVPIGRLMPPGIGLQIDGGKPQKLDYMVCFPDRCLAEVPLTDNMVASFKKGTALTLTSVNFQNQQNPVKVSLQGFTGAFDGEPLQKADLEQKQKQVDEYVKKNDEEFAKKMKEAQDAAKAGN